MYKFYSDSSPQSEWRERDGRLNKGLCGVSSPTGLKPQQYYSKSCCFHSLLITQASWDNQVMQEANERGNAEWRVYLGPDMIVV